MTTTWVDPIYACDFETKKWFDLKIKTLGCYAIREDIFYRYVTTALHVHITVSKFLPPANLVSFSTLDIICFCNYCLPNNYIPWLFCWQYVLRQLFEYMSQQMYSVFMFIKVNNLFCTDVQKVQIISYTTHAQYSYSDMHVGWYILFVLMYFIQTTSHNNFK